MLNATLFDDGLDAYVYNYNIEPPSNTAIIEGYAFTVEYNDMGITLLFSKCSCNYF